MEKSRLLLLEHNGGREMGLCAFTAGKWESKYLIPSSIASPNANSMPVPKFWLTARVAEGDSAWDHPGERMLCARPQRRLKSVFFNTLSPFLPFLRDP